MLKANGEIYKAIGQLEFRLGKAAFLAEVKDVGDASGLANSTRSSKMATDSTFPLDHQVLCMRMLSAASRMTL